MNEEPDHVIEGPPVESNIYQLPQQLPHNLEAEKGLLGAILLNNKAFDVVSELVRPEYFAYESHGVIYEAMANSVSKGSPVDAIILTRFFEASDRFKEIGGSAYLAELVSAAASVINAKEYARIIKDLFLKREIILFGQELDRRSYLSGAEDTAKSVLEFADQSLFALMEPDRAPDQEREAGLDEALSVIEQRYQNPDKLTGITTGIDTLDRQTMGLQRGDLIILAGRTSMGKTTMAQKLGTASAQNNEPVDFFSMEMPAHQIWQKILSEQSSVPLNFILSGKYHRTPTQPEIVFSTGQRLRAELPINVISGSKSVSEIRSGLRRSIRKSKTGLVIIDQLSHIRDTSEYTQRTHQYGSITKSLKAMAMELNVPVVLLHQINRGVANRDDKRPNLSDLRDSGEIEQDADVVMFVHREHYDLERNEPKRRPNEKGDDFQERYDKWVSDLERLKHDAEIIIAKQRMGPVTSVHVHYDGSYSRFGSRAYEGVR